MDVHGFQALFDFPDDDQSPLGRRTGRLIRRRLRQLWPSAGGRRLLGYGFAEPYLRGFLPDAERLIAAVPAIWGDVVPWPPNKSLTVLVEEEALPFPDAFFDLILVVHGLEEAEGLRPLLRQLWRGNARPSGMAGPFPEPSWTGCCAGPCSSRSIGSMRFTRRLPPTGF